MKKGNGIFRTGTPVKANWSAGVLDQEVGDMAKLQVKLCCRVWFEHEGEYTFGPGVFRLIKKVNELGSLKKAAEDLRMPYRGAWGRIRKAEQALGISLLESTNERHQGMKATAEALEMVAAYDSICSRNKEYLSSIAQDFPYLETQISKDEL